MRLKLQEYDSNSPPQEHVSIDIPDDVKQEFREKVKQTQEILNRADLHDFLKEINVKIIINATASRAS